MPTPCSLGVPIGADFLSWSQVSSSLVASLYWTKWRQKGKDGVKHGTVPADNGHVLWGPSPLLYLVSPSAGASFRRPLTATRKRSSPPNSSASLTMAST